MGRSLVEVDEMQSRVFRLFRLVRHRQDPWVSRVAPVLAAKLNINEGDCWHALMGEVRRLQHELSVLDLEKMLATGSTDDGETGEDRDETEGTDDA